MGRSRNMTDIRRLFSGKADSSADRQSFRPFRRNTMSNVGDTILPGNSNTRSKNENDRTGEGTIRERRENKPVMIRPRQNESGASRGGTVARGPVNKHFRRDEMWLQFAEFLGWGGAIERPTGGTIIAVLQ